MTTGKQLAALLLLTTALTMPGVAFAQDSDEALLDEVEGVDDEPEEDVDISLPGGNNTIIVTGRINRDPTRSSSQVISVLSAEQIARTGEGDIAGALGRVTGLSVVGQGLVYVRGLGDRYSLALLNGVALPSPQPLSRVVPLDIFPTNIVASSLVQKTYSANFSGEFGGGVINLTTSAVPDESFLSLSVGTSGDTETTFQNGLSYYGSDFDWFGFDDGTRDNPPALADFFASGERMSDLSIEQQGDIAKQLGNPNFLVLQKIGDLPANWSAGINTGTSIDVFGDGQLGVIATANISNTWRNREVTQEKVFQGFTPDQQFNNFVTDNRTLANALLGLGLEVSDHRFRWTNVFIRDSLKQSVLGFGEDFQDNDSIQRQSTAWYERQLMNTQFIAELDFDAVTVDLRGAYAQTQREAPFEYDFTYERRNIENSPDPLDRDFFINRLDRQTGSGTVAFSDLTEDLWTGGIDVGYAAADWMNVTVGYAYSDTDRFSERREFFFQAPSTFPSGVGLLRPDLLLGDAVIDYFDIGLVESTQSSPAFLAELTVHAGYGMVDLAPLPGVALNAGVRYETAEQSVVPVEVFSTPLNSNATTLLENEYLLPAATFTWEVTDSLQLRANASQTIARPQFRELVFQAYFDPETNRAFNGNPDLIDSELLNFEARAEYYLDRSSRIAIAGFFKDITNPIEAFGTFSENSDGVFRFANAPSATLYGAEFDIQYSFDLMSLGGFFETKDLVLFGNYTYTKSELEVGPDDLALVFPSQAQPASNFFVDGVPLTGQSDHIANFQISLEDVDRLQQFTALINYASERVTARGTNGLPDIVQDPGLTIDLVYRQGIALAGVDAELKLEARNLTGRDNLEFQSDGTQRIEFNSYDVGQRFAASLSVNF